jgi:putative DNA primase/helicase
MTLEPDIRRRLDAAAGQLNTGLRKLPHQMAAAFIGGAYQRYIRYCEDSRRWLVWNGCRWQDEKGSAAINAIIVSVVHSHFDRLMTSLTPVERANLLSNGWLSQVEQQLRLLMPLVCVSTDFDADPWLIGTPGGVVDLRNSKFYKPQPEQMISMQTAVDPAPKGTKTPQFSAFLKWMTCNETADERFIRMWFGRSLVGNNSDQKMLFTWGDSANGKSVLLRSVALTAGSYHTTAAATTFMQRHGYSHGPNPNLVKILQARLVTGTEVPKGAEWDNQVIKQICSDEEVEARRLYENGEGMAPRCTVALAGNDLPTFSGLDDAIKRRFLTMHCKAKRQASEQIADYGRELFEAEGPGILRWMLEGALDRQVNGFITPDSVTKASQEYFDSEDVLAQFVDENYKRDADGFVGTTNMFDSWQQFNKRLGRPRDLTLTAFVLRLHKMGFESGRDSGRTHRVIKGLSMLTPKDLGL